MAVEVQNDPSRFSHIRGGFLSKLRVMKAVRKAKSEERQKLEIRFIDLLNAWRF